MSFFNLLSLLSNLRLMNLSSFSCLLLFHTRWGLGGSETEGFVSFLYQPQSPACSVNIPACVAHTTWTACHCCYTCWIKGGLNATFWLLTWYSNWYSQGSENGTNAMSVLHFFVCFHCQSRRSCAGICPWPTPRSQCVVRAYY